MIKLIKKWRTRRKLKKFLVWFNAHYDLSNPKWDDRCPCGVAYWERWEGKTCNCTNVIGTT